MTGHELSPRRALEPMVLADRLPATALPATPPQGTRSLMLWLFFLGVAFFGVLGTWAATASMRSAVIASGLFRVQGENLAVQHLEGGIVHEIAVKEGQIVQKGDLLFRLDDTRARAGLDILLNQLAGALATEARLLAEMERAESIRVPDELQAMIAAEPSFGAALKTQIEVFDAGRQLDIGQVQILHDRVRQLNEQAQGLRHRVATLSAQHKLLSDELGSQQTLYGKGLATKAQYFALQRDEAAISGDIAVTGTQLQTTLQQIAEVEARKLQVRRDRLNRIAEARDTVQEQIFDLRQRIAAAQDTLDRTRITAPTSGRVMGLQVNTPGAVLGEGQVLAGIVPADSPLVVEVKVSPADINQVHQGGEARVRLTAYNYRTTPMVRGWLTHVSPDIFSDPKTGAPFYRAEITLDAAEMTHLPGVEMLAGMPAQVMIATGEQTLADYLLRPVLGGIEVALSENE